MLANLKISDPQQEGNLSFSKWNQQQVLIDEEEMETVLALLKPFFLLNVSSIGSLQELEVIPSQFLSIYQNFVKKLKNQEISLDPLIKKQLSCALTSDRDSFYAYEVYKGKYLIKALKPLIQIQFYQFSFSKTNTILPMGIGIDRIYWGVQISYPYISYNSKKGLYEKVINQIQFPNTGIFFKLLQWIRNATFPTTFIYKGNKIGTSLRLGARCFNWIHQHPQLVQQNIQIHLYTKNLNS